jgi:glycosyltransferase involved in cell wall biosynthesis
MNKIKLSILRITTVQESLEILLKGQLRFFKEQGFEVWMASSITDLTRIKSLEERENSSHFALPLTRKITPLKDLIAIWKTYSLIKKLKPSIVHTHTPKAGMVGMIAAWLAGVPIRLHTIAGLPLMEKIGFTKQLLIYIEKITYLFATAIYPNSFGLHDFITKNISNSSKIRVIGNGSSNGIDIEHYKKTDKLIAKSSEIKNNLELNQKFFIWIFIGRVVKDKGINELIEAFVSFQKENSKNYLIIVGNFEQELDPLLPEIKDLINNHEYISHVGFQNDIRPYLLMADVLVFPSYREGLPNVPMQASCLDLPVIATDINGCNEIVKHKINGILIKPKCKYSIKHAMELIYNNESLRNKISSKTRQLTVYKYDQKTVWTNLLNEYIQLLKNV